MAAQGVDLAAKTSAHYADQNGRFHRTRKENTSGLRPVEGEASAIFIQHQRVPAAKEHFVVSTKHE